MIQKLKRLQKSIIALAGVVVIACAAGGFFS
jgi:hypothetical protein